ncbi:hypothetical protein cypCar_00032511 [Cyprinus carpio]|nr:hypothetical protein cypCar_00032511 [Cyprinus carpio]
MAEKNAFVVADLGALMRQHVLWKTTMPLIRPFYPVSCNSSPVVIEVLSALGVGFVCANKAETTLVLDHDVPPENIILSGVCKQLSLIKHAAKTGINYLVCENEAELRKIARAHPEAKLLLQVSTDAQVEEASVTIGCSLKSCRHLLEMAKDLSVNVVGVTFQVPASCRDPQAYTHALSDARCIFDMAKELGFDMKILDIGGGFSGSEFQLKQLSLTLDEPVFSSSLWGPSCDPLDQVVEHCLLPELAVGDWLIFSNMGASSHEGPATISDTDQPPVYYTISTDDW